MDEERSTTAGEAAFYISLIPWFANACRLTGAG